MIKLVELNYQEAICKEFNKVFADKEIEVINNFLKHEINNSSISFGTLAGRHSVFQTAILHSIEVIDQDYYINITMKSSGKNKRIYAQLGALQNQYSNLYVSAKLKVLKETLIGKTIPILSFDSAPQVTAPTIESVEHVKNRGIVKYLKVVDVEYEEILRLKSYKTNVFLVKLEDSTLAEVKYQFDTAIIKL